MVIANPLLIDKIAGSYNWWRTRQMYKESNKNNYWKENIKNKFSFLLEKKLKLINKKIDI